MDKKTNKLNELAAFESHLIEYTNLRHSQLKSSLSSDENQKLWNLFKVVSREVGRLEPLITELTKIKSIDVHGKDYDMWFIGLRPDLDEMAVSALGFCIQVTNRAIGRLQDDVQMGLRDIETGRLKLPQIQAPYITPKAFISHGKESVALDKLAKFLVELGIIPLIVKEQPSLDKTVDDKVQYYLNESDFVVILATCDDEFDGKWHPRQNVIHEIGLAQKTREGKIIYLLEEGCEFPSNISPKVWERFKKRNMMNSLLTIVRELRAYGILLSTKPAFKERPH